jgi:hypothetical protein
MKIFSLLSPLIIVLLYLISIIEPDLGKNLQEIYFIVLSISFLIIFKRLCGSIKNINTLFLFIFLFFIGSRIIFDFFNVNDISEVNFFYKHTLSKSTVNLMIFNINLSLFSYIIGGLIFYKYLNFNSNNLFPSTVNLNIKKLIVFMFLLGVIIKSKLAIDTVRSIIEYGYLAYFTGDFIIEKSIIDTFFEAFILIGIFYFYNKRDVSTKIIISILVWFTIVQLSTGQRGPGLLFFLFSIFYLERNGKIKLNYSHVFFGSILLFLISIFMLSFRSGSDTLNYGILNFIWSQSGSINILSYAIDFQNSIDYSFIDFFGNIRHEFNRQFYRLIGMDYNLTTLDVVNEYKLYSGLISEKVNPTMHSLGYGLGGSYLAQFYSFGGSVAQFVGGAIVAIMMNFFYKLLYFKSFLIRYLGFIFLLNFIYIPRDNFLDFTTENWTSFIAILILLFFSFILKVSKSHYLRYV